MTTCKLVAAYNLISLFKMTKIHFLHIINHSWYIVYWSRFSKYYYWIFYTRTTQTKVCSFCFWRICCWRIEYLFHLFDWQKLLVLLCLYKWSMGLHQKQKLSMLTLHRTCLTYLSCVNYSLTRKLNYQRKWKKNRFISKFSFQVVYHCIDS